MAREERVRFLVVFMLGQLGAGIWRAALSGQAVTSWRGDTGSCAVSPHPGLHMQVLEALREAGGAAQNSRDGRCFSINAKGLWGSKSQFVATLLRAAPGQGQEQAEGLCH